MPEKREASEYSKAVADVILGLYKGKRWNQEKLAEKANMKVGTLRRMISGESEIDARALSILAGVLGTTPQRVLDVALEEYGGLERLVAEVSAVPDNVTTLQTRPDTAEEVDNYREPSAANAFDSEADQPDE